MLVRPRILLENEILSSKEGLLTSSAEDLGGDEELKKAAVLQLELPNHFTFGFEYISP